jgi:hypothetical protein
MNENKNRRFKDEIYPAIKDDESGFGETASALGELTNDLRELSKGSGINLDRFVTTPFQKIEIGLQKYGHWRDVSIKHVGEVTDALRALKEAEHK